MELLTNTTSLALWQDVVRRAEGQCDVILDEHLESYLVMLLNRYTNRPEMINRVIATAFLEAIDLPNQQRLFSLQEVGDQCLLFAGLFPKIAEKRQVKLGYFVDMGRSAYSAISDTTNDLYGNLAIQFVILMDILQSIRTNPELMPMEAYEQWQELGSQRAYKILLGYTSKA